MMLIHIHLNVIGCNIDSWGKKQDLVITLIQMGNPKILRDVAPESGLYFVTSTLSIFSLCQGGLFNKILQRPLDEFQCGQMEKRIQMQRCFQGA